ncbi:hypothetical protein U1Q18_037023 [Sarracenia purpurea var. burkii]
MDENERERGPPAETLTRPFSLTANLAQYFPLSVHCSDNRPCGPLAKESEDKFVRVSANREQRSIRSSYRRLGFRRLGTRVLARANRRREDQATNGGTILAPISLVCSSGADFPGDALLWIFLGFPGIGAELRTAPPLPEQVGVWDYLVFGH